MYFPTMPHDELYENATVSKVGRIYSKEYRKQGKIRWAKLSRIPPNEVFHRKTFTVPYVYNI